jgi:hypothetical protein
MLNSAKEIILSSYDQDPSKLIGLIVANDGKREWWAKDLQKDDKPRREARPIISTYVSNQKNGVHIDFDQGGIVVLNDKSNDFLCTVEHLVLIQNRCIYRWLIG